MMILMNDKPLDGKNNNEFDKLKLNKYAEVLSNFIKNCETPMTIGLQGDWGIGKSTLLNMLRVKLGDTQGIEKNRKHPIIDFNTWQYSMFGQDEYLGLAAVNALLKNINNRFATKDKPVGPLSKAMKVGSACLKSVKFGLGPISIDTAKTAEAISNINNEDLIEFDYDDISEKMIELKKLFNDTIKVITKNYPSIEKIIFFIDDIDRVKPVKALELLECLKNFFDVEHCVFVLAVDYEVVQMGMAQKLGIDLQKTSGKSFFDKIINLPFPMPTQSYSLEEYIEDLFKKNGLVKKSIKKSDYIHLTNIASTTVGRNPRSLKRAINYLTIIQDLQANIGVNKLRKKTFGEVKDSRNSYNEAKDIKLSWALVCMQIAWPELYSYFVANPSVETLINLEDWEYIDSLPQTKRLYERVRDEDEVKNNISEFFDILYEIVDTNNDDEISHEEFLSILYTMASTSMVDESLLDEKPPYYEFVNNAIKNCKSNKNHLNHFLNKLLRETEWFKEKKITIKKSSGRKYISLVYDRKRLGTMVTLVPEKRSNLGFSFRINYDDEILINKLKQEHNIIKLSDDRELEYEKIIHDFSGRATGWGQTEININYFLNNYDYDDEKNKRALMRLLNQIYRAITG